MERLSQWNHKYRGQLPEKGAFQRATTSSFARARPPLGPKLCPRGFNNISWDIWVLLSVFYKPSIKNASNEALHWATGVSPRCLSRCCTHRCVVHTKSRAAPVLRPKQKRFVLSHKGTCWNINLILPLNCRKKVSFFFLFIKFAAGNQESKSESSFNTEVKRNLWGRLVTHGFKKINFQLKLKRNALKKNVYLFPSTYRYSCSSSVSLQCPLDGFSEDVHPNYGHQGHFQLLT